MKVEPKEIHYHPRIGYAKARELYIKHQTAQRMLTAGGRQKEISNVVQGGIVRELIEQYLPRGHRVGHGLVYSTKMKKHSPESDAIVYSGFPLIGFADVVVTEKNQTSLIVETKGQAKIGDLFGQPKKDKQKKTRVGKNGMPIRDSKTILQTTYKEKRDFGKKYVLFIFSLEVTKKISDDDVQKKLDELSDIWVVAWRKVGKNIVFDYGKSVSKFIERLKALGH